MAIVCPLCPQDACCHFKPVSPDPNIKTDGDLAPAKLGHLNKLVDQICCISNDVETNKVSIAALTALTLKATATLDFPSTLAQTSSELTIAVLGAIVGSPVVVGTPAAPAANSAFTAYVSAPGIVTVRFNNYSAAPIDPISGSFTVKVFL
jgi:hypothetical protein